MIADYVYCPHCGYEDFDVYVYYSFTDGAETHWFYCPICGEETSQVIRKENNHE